MANFKGRFKHAWNAFLGRDAPPAYIQEDSTPFARRQDGIRRSLSNERTMLNAVINRMAVDAAKFRIEHCIVNDNDQYQERVNSLFNDVLNNRANIDQTSRAFFKTHMNLCLTKAQSPLCQPILMMSRRMKQYLP